MDRPRSASLTFGLSDGTHNPSGFLGGLQAGCDYQFAGGFVIGIAGDYAWTNADATSTSVLFIGQTNHSRVKGLASVTGRFGYAWDRFLGYVKGGGAWENDDHDFVNTTLPPFGCACTGTASASRSGWTVDIGGEYAFTNFLTGFAEYNYYDFGTRDITFSQTDGATFRLRHQRKPRASSKSVSISDGAAGQSWRTIDRGHEQNRKPWDGPGAACGVPVAHVARAARRRTLTWLTVSPIRPC